MLWHKEIMNRMKQRISDWQPRKLLCFSAAFSVIAAACTVCISYDLDNWIIKLGVPTMLFSLAILLVFREKLVSFTFGTITGFIWCVAFTVLLFSPTRDLAGYGGDLQLRVLEDYTAGEAASIEVTVLKGPGINREAKARLFLDRQDISLRPGDCLSLNGTVKEGNLDLSKNRLQKGIYLTVNCTKNSEMVVVPDGALNLTCRAARFSKAIQQKIQSLIPGDQGNLLAAMISGDSDLCGEKLQAALVRTGLAHIAAVSGLHISILTGFFVTVFGKRKGFLIALPLIIAYAMIAGASPSAMRAVIMQVILMISVFFYREYDAMTALFAALLLLLLQNPFSILSASLMLSFSATFGILLLNGVLLQMFWRHRPKNRALAKIYGWIVSTITVSFSAMVFTMPVTLLIFGSASMLSLISNLLIIWAVSGVMIGGIFMLAAAVISMALAEILAKILHVPLTYMVWVITKLGGLVEFVGQSGSFVLEVAALLVLLCMILVRISKKEQAFGVVTAIITLIFGFAVSSLDPVLYNEVQIFGNYGAPIVLIRDGARTIAVGTGEDPENSIYHMEDALTGWNRSDLSAVICLSDRLKSTGGLTAVRKELDPEHIFLPIHGYVEGMDQGSFWAFSDGGVLPIPDATGKIELIPLTNDIWAMRWTGKTVSFLLLFDGQPLELAAGLENYRGDVSADVLITDAKLLDSSHASAYVCRRVSPQVIFAADSSFDSVPAQVLGVPVTSLNEQESITLVTKR